MRWAVLQDAHVRAPLTALVLVVLLLSGLGGAASAGPAHHRPTVGSCHDYGFDQVGKASESSPTVSCSEPHTALTVAVLRFDGTRDVASTEKAVTGCGRALVDLLDRPVLTAYDLGFFFPTRAEVAKGARWVRCDLVLFVDRTLAPLSDPIVTDPVDDTVAHCAIDRRRELYVTTCSSPHTYRTTSSVKLLGRGGYPGVDRLLLRSLRRCEPAVLDPSDYVVVFPTDLEWRAGYRTVACQSRTSS